MGEIEIFAEVEPIQKQSTVDEMDFSEALVVMYSEGNPTPLQIDNNELEEDLASKANSSVQSNTIKLTQQFGVDIKGCKEEAYALLMKLDQRREKEMKQGEGLKATRSNSIIPKEVRNLFFDMNFKDGEPRSSGRSLVGELLTLNYQ